MILKVEPEIEISAYEDGDIYISQPGFCPDCRSDGTPYRVTLSPHRARLVAAELVRLADEIEAEGGD